MDAGFFGLLFLMLIIGAVIILPIYFRNRLQQKQLETITMAIEKGVDPAKIWASLPKQERTADPNGNWKAGIILVALGLTFGLAFAFVLAAAGAMDESRTAFLFGILIVVLGGILMRIHKSIIGAVVKADEVNGEEDEISRME